MDKGESGRVRVAVANDYAVVVAGVAGMLAPYAEELTVVEKVSRAEVTAEVDVVLFDTFGQAQGAALDVDRVKPHDEAKLIVYSWNTHPDLVRASLEAGASAYLSKSLDGEHLKEAILRVHAGEHVVPAGDPAELAVAEPDDDVQGRWPGHEIGLSARESEVLALLCQGLSNHEIGERAFLGVNTIKTHLRTMFRKIGVESRTQAVLWAMDHGFRPDHLRRD